MFPEQERAFALLLRPSRRFLLIMETADPAAFDEAVGSARLIAAFYGEGEERRLAVAAQRSALAPAEILWTSTALGHLITDPVRDLLALQGLVDCHLIDPDAPRDRDPEHHPLALMLCAPDTAWAQRTQADIDAAHRAP